jgi:hypothetical protein
MGTNSLDARHVTQYQTLGRVVIWYLDRQQLVLSVWIVRRFLDVRQLMCLWGNIYVQVHV